MPLTFPYLNLWEFEGYEVPENEEQELILICNKCNARDNDNNSVTSLLGEHPESWLVAGGVIICPQCRNKGSVVT